MARRKSDWRQRGIISAALVCACAGLALAGPGIALAAVGNAVSALPSEFGPFTPASVETGAGTSHLMRFTPAGSAIGRSITVAVRIDDETARAISVRSAIASANDQLSGSAIEITPTRYDLGVARGYQSFAQAKPAVSAAVPQAQIADIAMPDLSDYRPSPTAKGKPSRFSARLALEKDAKAGRAPNTLESLGDQTVDLGGALRVTHNLNVTAGVRYSQDRDRIAPLTDDGEQDSQAVYVGTQFHF